MKPIQLISQDLFDKVRSRFTNLEMGDETGAVTIDPAEARFFDFDFVNEGVDLGRVSMSLNDLGSLKIYYSQGITENQDDHATQMWYNFLKEMRLFAMRRLLRFDTRDIAKTNLDKNDFQHLAATQGPKEEPDMNTMNETKKIKKSVAEGSHEEQVARLAAYNEKMAGKNPPIELGLREVGNWAKVGHYGDPIKTAWLNIAKYGVRNNRFNNSVEKVMSAISEFPDLEDEVYDMYDINQDEVDILYNAYETVYDQWEQLQGQQGVAEGLQESRWNNKSSRKTSRAVQGKTEVIVRHAHAVEETYPGARSQSKNIKAIFIQNADGERFKYPFIHTAGAFAMAQHVDHGGVPHDPAGKAIIKMSENIAKLGEFQRHIQRSSLHADAHGIAERAIGHMNELKTRIAALGKRHHYQAWKEEFEASGMGEPADEMMLDAVTLEDYKSKFTQTNFQEELVGFFPLLHSIMREANTVDLEEYVEEAAAPWEDEEADDSEKDKDDQTNTKGSDGAEHGGHSRARHLARQAIPKEKSAAESINSFEEWADSTEQGKLTDDQMNHLKAAIEALPQGPNGPQLDSAVANDFFSDPELGLTELPNFEELTQALQDEEGRDEEIRATPLQLFQTWAKENNPELLASLGMTGAEEPAPAPEAPPAPEPAPEQPVAEGKSSMVHEVAKIVKSFYNADNESVGPFRAEENIALDCKKQISEKFGEKAGEQAYEMAEAFINKLTQEWQQKHGQIQKHSPVDQGDGLSVDSLKEILGRIKSKVEGIGKPEMEEKDEWHPSKHVTDPQKKKELEPHDKDVKRGSYADRANYLDAAGVKRDTQQDEGFVGNMIDKAKGMFGKTPAAPAAPAPATGNNGAHADGKPNSWMEPDMRKDFENTEISTFLLYNIRMIYRWAKEGRNIRNYIQDLKKLEHENISKPTTAAAFKFIMDNLASGEVTDPKMIMQIADKAHTLMGHSDIEQATREGVDKSQVPAVMRKEKGGDWKMSTQDLEKERDQSRTTKPGLDAHKAKLGMSEEIADIMRLVNHKK